MKGNDGHESVTVVAVGEVPKADVYETESSVVLDAGYVPFRSRWVGVSLRVMALALRERRVNAKSWRQLEKLAARCSDALRDKQRQSEHIFRGDMWAVIGACHDIRKAREKAPRKQAVAKDSAAQSLNEG